MKKNLVSTIIGILLVICGLGYLGMVFGVWNFTIFFDGWWTLFLIIPAIISMIEQRLNFGNVSLFMIGAIFLTSSVFDLSYSLTWALIVSVILIVLGVNMIVGRRNTPLKSIDHDVRGENYIDISKIFSGSDVIIDSTDFKGGKITSVFSGNQLDLRNIKLQSDIMLNINCIFSSVDILVPNYIKVIANGCNSAFGSVQNKSMGISSTTEKVYNIYVNGNCVFGSVDIY